MSTRAGTGTLHVRSGLADSERAAILALAERTRARDGVDPLNEDAVLGLGGHAPAVTHLLLTSGAHEPDDADLRGYAQLHAAGHTADVVIGPEGDRAAVGEALLAALEERTGPVDLVIWAHGERSPVGAVAADRGYRPDRVLLQLGRDLDPAAPSPAVPPGVVIRAFVPGRDDAAWLRVNARAFAHHREQGSWTQSDLDARLASAWFDAAGFFLAEDAADGTLLGFHWTKVHPAGQDAAPLGEVYVIATDPLAQGRGLGSVLLAVGLKHLYDIGARQVMLYTDESNVTARHVYEKAGFSVWRTDTQYRLARA